MAASLHCAVFGIRKDILAQSPPSEPHQNSVQRRRNLVGMKLRKFECR